MPVATLQATYFEQQWRINGRRHFSLVYSATMTDDYVLARMPQTFLDNASTHSVTVTNVDIFYTDQDAAGTVNLGYPFITMNGNSAAYLNCPVTSAKKYTVFNFTNLEAGVEASMMRSTSTLAWIGTVTGHAATDECALYIRGYIESVRLAPELQAVSVEGYKWPLQRRY